MKFLTKRVPVTRATGPIVQRSRAWQMPLLGLLLAMFASTAISTRAQDAPQDPEKKSAWERSAAAGLTLTKGNSDTLLFSASVDASKKWEKNELSMGASATYGEHENQDTGENEKDNESARGFIQYNRLLTERWFAYGRAELYHDAIADVDYRFTLSPGLGYYFIKEERTKLSGEVGPGFVYEKQGDDEGGYFTLRLAERFEHKFNKRARIWQSAELLPQVDDFDNFLVNAELGVEADLTEKLSLRVLVQDTYDNQPAEGRKKNDVKLITALALKF